ncbi:hypothetical protein [Vreelandella gomseomensis]|uniref:Uncharacterized protein n=1 Tax=Vreelandella gomseomensis TaxID=370766 RepID=A0ABU1GDF6_9GAMM|nr:hypothetical protein [Halomonas gomseomensis]MDR5875529.1 hypothetical protein [Halomonas gomseomensis]
MISEEKRFIIKEIATARSFKESIEFFNLTQDFLGDCRFIFASDHGSEPGLSIGLDFKDGSAIRSLFNTEKVLVLDKVTLREMSRGRADFSIDYSISLDNQALSYLEPYISGNEKKLPNDFKDIFLFISKDSVFVDPMPYIHENYYNLNDERAAGRIFDKLKAYEILRNIDFDSLENESIVKAKVSDYELMKNTQQHIARMFTTLSEVRFMKELDFKFNCQYVFLLKMVSIQLGDPKKSKFSKVLDFLDFCHFDVATIGFREVLVANEFFEKGQDFAFFNKVQKNKEDLFRVIKGMAWDLYHVRQMECLATIRPDERARYFFPSFLTCDKRLVEILDLYPLKCLAYIEGAYEPLPFFDGDILEALTQCSREKDELCSKYFTQSSAN